jgi:dTDP-4-amino-4,6-dideoxygalactose transaminase
LRYLDKWNDRRHQIAKYYNDNIKNDWILPMIDINVKTVWHLYVVQAQENREKIMDKLLSYNIQTLIHYPVPCHKSAAYKSFNHLSFPTTEKISNSIFSLPMGPHLDDSQVNYIVDKINKI